MKRFAAIDLFAGAGGMSLGAVRAGMRVALAVERDPNAARTYAANHRGTAVFSNDIRRLTPRRIRAVGSKGRTKIVFGGPPCQGFSYSNVRTRSAENADNWLFLEFIRVVRLWKPDWVVFENVKGIADTAGGVFVDHVVEQLEELGYAMAHGLLNAKDFGVPQDRARFFLIGCRTGIRPRLPRPSRRKSPTVAQAISDLPVLDNGASVSWIPYGDALPSYYARRLRNGKGKCPNHLVTRNCELVIRRYSHIPPGGNWENIPARLMRNYADRMRCHTGIYHRLRANRRSVVIGNFRKNMLIHPTQDRGLSVREAARIQSFPDDYEFHGSIGFQQQQVGNAVPPLLAEAVFKAIIAAAN
ncbi:MAG: DNA cytosine methyltransferase [Candidatus Nealsonbacteria bacterium]|nr:DNA cytosine methyltransferase [Candidatus Nealsonbacteria bacterium]